MKKVEIHFDREYTLAGSLHEPPGGAAPSRAVLFAHGWGGGHHSDEDIAAGLAARGAVALTFSMRGHGHHHHGRDRVTRLDSLRDLLAAHDWLAERHPDLPLGWIGISYGGYIAAVGTLFRRPAWLSLQAPAIYQDAAWDVPKRALHADPALAELRRRPLEPEENLALLAASRYDGPALVIESRDDKVIPPQTVANYVRVLRAEHVIIDADHCMESQAARTAWIQTLSEWLDRSTPGDMHLL